MFDFCERSAFLYGKKNIEHLHRCTVAIAGLGGVGSIAAEALARLGVGRLILIDSDTVANSNRNRQLIATADNIGIAKSDECRKRLLSINPYLEAISIVQKISTENFEFIFEYPLTAVVDAIDTVSAKIKLISVCYERNIPIISSMGAGNRLNPTAVKFGDLTETIGCGCGLARVVRKELRKLGIEHLPVTYSTEFPRRLSISNENGKHIPASSPFVPQAAGLALAYGCAEILIGQNVDV